MPSHFFIIRIEFLYIASFQPHKTDQSCLSSTMGGFVVFRCLYSPSLKKYTGIFHGNKQVASFLTCIVLNVQDKCLNHNLDILLLILVLPKLLSQILFYRISLLYKNTGNFQSALVLLLIFFSINRKDPSSFFCSFTL